MSPFIIFAIVFTLAYILYYATLILMDLKVKPKQNEEQGEHIAAGDEQEETDGFTPQTVVENTMTGGFEFVKTGNKTEEAPAEAAESIQSPVEPAEQNHLPEARDSSESSQTQSDEKSSEPIPEDSTEAAHEPEDISEPAEEEEEIPGITRVDFSDAPQAEEPSEEPFDETDAFDPDLALPQYGVTTVVGEKKDPEAERIISDVNDKLISGPYSLGCLMNETELKEEVQKNSNTNIEHTDEATHY